MVQNAQTWLDNLGIDKNTETEIYAEKPSVPGATPAMVAEELNGELRIENFPELELLSLKDVGELDKLNVNNCPKLKEIDLQNSGVLKLELGSGLDSLVFLNFSFEVNAFHGRPNPRKLDELDVSNASNLKVIRCLGIHETKLTGIEKLTQLQQFDSGDDTDDTEVAVLPTGVFREWKKNLDAITVTDPNHLDLLKGGSGVDKDEVDPNKLKNYKQKAADYDRIYAKLGGKVSDSDLDDLLNSPGSGLQSQLDQAKQKIKDVELERDHLQRELSEAVSKLLKSIVTELNLQLKNEDITEEKVLEKKLKN